MRLDRILIVTLLMVASSMAFFDDFQSYNSVTDASFTSNYSIGIVPLNYISIASAPSDSLTVLYTSVDSSMFISINDSKLNLSYPFAFSATLRNGSTISSYYLGGEFSIWYFLNNTNSNSNISVLHGYRFRYIFRNWYIPNDTVVLERFNPSSSVSLASVQISALDFNRDNTFIVSMDNDKRAHFYINNIEKLNYYDSAEIYLSGGIGILEHLTSQAGYDFLYLDDLNSNATIGGVGANFSVIGYPDYSPDNVTLVERVNYTLASWVALNQPFDQIFSFMTPAGIMSQYTEMSCPVRIAYEYDWTPTYLEDYPAVLVQASDSNSANKCVRRIEYSYYQPYYNGYFCLAPYMCVFSWQSKEQNITYYDQPIPYGGWVGEGGWRSAYKILDINGKMYYETVQYVCTAPANLTFAMTYKDRKGCADGALHPYYWNLTNIGICPSTGEACDLQLNYSCWYQCNGSRNIPAPTCAGGNCTLPPNLPPYIPPTTVPPTGAEEAGVTNPFDPSQSGSIWTALLSPAFIGLVICIILALMGAVYGGQLIGAMGFIGAFFFMTWWGLFPLWVGLGVIVLASFVTVYMIRDIFTGD